MMKKVHIIKGSCDGITIRNTTLPLIKEINIENGVAKAFVDATAVFGVEAGSVLVKLQEYREL